MESLKELEKKYKELGEEIERLKKAKNAGFKEDAIFLLSVEEYEYYKDNIPFIREYWWLRSPGFDSRDAAFVHYYGAVDLYGNYVNYGSSAVRPALKPSLISNLKSKNLGEAFDYLGVRWIRLDDDLYISEMPIGYEMFDEKSNDYETSHIRKWLLDWLDNREDLYIDKE